MEWISSKLVYFILKNKTIKDDPDHIAFYKYGIEITISSILSCFFVIIIGIITGYFVDSVVFLITLLFVRSYTGGYHASTYARCNISMCLSFISIIFLKTHIANAFSIIGYALLIPLIVLIVSFFCPVENRFKPISKEKRPKLRIASIVVSSLMCTLSMCLIVFSIKLGETIMFTMVIVSLLVIVGFIKERRNENECNS